MSGLTRVSILAAATAAALTAGCSQQAKREQGVVRAFVSVPPQAFFVQRLGGDHVAVSVLVSPGQDPHTFEPSPKQAVELSTAAVYFRIGLPFEDQLLDKIASSLKGLTVVDLNQGLATRPEEEPKEGRDHGHEDLDPHTWLDPKLARKQAAVIAETLERLDPANKAEYQKNLQVLQADLDELDRQIATALAPLKGKTIYVFHPAFGYFCQSYGLNQKAVETGGKDPQPKQVLELVQQAKTDGVKVIFVQPQFSDRAARVIAEQIGGAVVPMDDLAPDYIANLQRMAAEIKKALAS